jgi:hypothetical protein
VLDYSCQATKLMDYLIHINLYLLSFLLYLYYIFVCFLMLSCTVVFVLGCNWPYLAVIKHINKRIELNFYHYTKPVYYGKHLAESCVYRETYLVSRMKNNIKINNKCKPFKQVNICCVLFIQYCFVLCFTELSYEIIFL